MTTLGVSRRTLHTEPWRLDEPRRRTRWVRIAASSGGITAAGDQLWRQSTRGVPGKAQSGDEFAGVSTCYVDEG